MLVILSLLKTRTVIKYNPIVKTVSFPKLLDGIIFFILLVNKIPPLKINKSLPISKTIYKVGTMLNFQRKMIIMPVNNLSANGSSNLPVSETKLYLRAKNPSAKSDKNATRIIAKI
ncbi:MAG: hypothetical protein WCZ90_11745 [Melioribacteraceae bacterium]